MNKAIAVQDLGDLHAAVALYHCRIAIYERLVHQEGRGGLASDLARGYIVKVVAAQNLGDLRGAVALCGRGIAIYERLVYQEGRGELANHLAAAYMLRGDWAGSILARAAAIAHLGNVDADEQAKAREAYGVLAQEVQRSGRSDLADLLNWAKSALAKVLG